MIVVFNLANVSLFFQAVAGLEQFLAGRSTLLTTVILGQVLVPLLAIWWGARRSAGAR
jgi:hypothetical protein